MSESRKRIEDWVARNRRGWRQLESYEVVVDSRPSRDFSFGGSLVEVDVTAEIYTRPLGGTMVFGHPDAAHGFGRGTFGDNRGSWTLQESISATDGEFTKDGRSAIADALEGTERGLNAAVVGSDGTAATTNDAALGTENGSVHAWGDKESTTETRGVGTFLFAEYGDVVTEVGLEADDGSLLCRLVGSGVNPSSTEEAKVEIVMEFTGDGVADAVITNDGEEAIADSIRSKAATVGLEKIVIGTGTTQAQKSDTSLETQVGSKDCARDRLTERVRAFIKWYADEPAGQPYDISEMGILDNQGRLVFRVTFDSFLKDDEVEPTTGATIRIV